MSADLALLDGNVLTINPLQPTAQAIAVKSGVIVKVGTNKEITQHIGKNTKIITLNGKTVIPGLIDTHIHIADFGRFLKWVDLQGIKSIKEMQKCIRKRARDSPKKWIIGRGWDQNCFAEKRLPTRFDLDMDSSDNPVILYHQNGQMCVVNSIALELAGITKQIIVPQGGTADKDEDIDELTGILRNTAMNLVWNIVPEPREEELVEAAILACKKIVEAGITSVHWMVLSSIEVSIIQKLQAQNRLPLRIYVIINSNLLDSTVCSKLNIESDDNALRIGGVVIFADGYLAARTAALFQPYCDSQATRGRLLYTQEEMNALAIKIRKANLQLVIHAMGDKAVDLALTTIEETSMKVSSKNFRSRIEQAAVLNEGLLQRIKKQNVIVSVQPCVIDSEFSVWSATNYLGLERARWLYPLKTLLKEDIKIVGGSDCPMEPLNPLLGLQVAVTRKFFPQEQITVAEALRIYTIDAAYSSGEESTKGSIEEEKLADLTILSHDPQKVFSNSIENIMVEMTIIGGKVVYSKN